MIDFVGAGPGAPDLITVRGMNLIKEADVIIYAGSLVNPEILNWAGKDCAVYDSSGMTLEETIKIMAEAEEKGLKTVRLHTGDPSLYGAILEQMNALDDAGIKYGYCPGVSSMFGAASALKTEFTPSEISQSVIITRAEGRTPVPEGESLESLASHGATMVIFLSASLADKVSRDLISGGYDKDTPAAIVYRVTWPDEKVIYTTVENIGKAAKENNITKTALIAVGGFLNRKCGRSKLYDPGFSHGFRRGADK